MAAKPGAGFGCQCLRYPRRPDRADDYVRPAGTAGLEPKAEIKKRILRSTDVGDAVALTFAEQVHLDRFALDEQVDDTVYC